MSGSDKPKTALDNASSINAFLSKILPVGKPRTVPAQAENVAAKVGELDISEDKATDTKANSTNASALPSTAVSNVASPDSKASDNISPEKISQWVQENAPPDHFKSKNPMVGTVQAQGTPQGSPQAAGVLAPPPTPETVSSQAIGRMIYDELDRIPEDRFMTLGDSKFAPHNQSRLRNTRLASNDQFFSAVPRSTKPRDDPGFTRMSFRAADAPTVPSWFNESKSETKATAAESSLVQGPPSAADLKKENARPSTSKDGWSQTTVNNGPPKVFTPDTTDSQAAASNIKPTRIEELKASKIFTPHTPDSPPVAPHLRPPRVEEVKASKVFTPDTPDDKLDEEESASRGGDAARTPLQELRAQENPFSTTNIPHLPKEDSKGRSAKEAAVAKPVINVKTTNLAPEESSNPSAGPLTPSSMTFTAVSPTKVRAAGITTAVQPAKIVGDNLEGALYFKAWPTQPKSDERASRSAAQHRLVRLTGLPRSSTPSFVASLVYGGPLESIRTTDGTTAFVTFLRPVDARKYYDATANGLLYKDKEGEEHVIMTGYGNDVDPISGVLRGWMEKEFTRCVRAVGVDEEWSVEALNKLAGNKGRKVEKVLDGMNVNGMRSITFRFCDIADAVKFKQTLNRSEDWEECNVHFAPDPCADATSVHSE